MQNIQLLQYIIRIYEQIKIPPAQSEWGEVNYYTAIISQGSVRYGSNNQKRRIIMKKQFTTVLSIVLLIIVAIFALVNTETVKVNLLVTHLSLSLVLLIFFCVLLGALIIFLFSIATNLRKRKEYKKLEDDKNAEIKQLHKKISDINKENDALNLRLKKSVSKQDTAK